MERLTFRSFSGPQNYDSHTDVAQAAGFSIATVSRLLNGIDYPLAEETRLKVLEVATQLGYKPNLIARITMRLPARHYHH